MGKSDSETYDCPGTIIVSIMSKTPLGMTWLLDRSLETPDQGGTKSR